MGRRRIPDIGGSLALNDRSPLIIARLNGGLGNQMFQFAAVRAVALRTGATLKLDTSAFPRDKLRSYDLGDYNLVESVAIASDAELAQCEQKKPRGLAVIGKALGLPKLGVSGAAIPAIREAHFHYDPALMAAQPPAYVVGYWQSERYFADAADQIRRDFTPREPLEPENAAVADVISHSTAVSLHVRRGDYVSDAKTQAVHGVCGLDYYARAMALVEAQLRGPGAGKHAAGPHYIVFSDDPDWTRANLTSTHPMSFVTCNPPNRGYRDIQLMSLCQHHIIANSSFSWWGAWLNGRPDKLVVAPRQWFASGGKDARDLVPVGWVRV
jgi:Glycosyl transferase family 11